MAVIVQKMIQAERSGVCFTMDPTGANPDEALIEASWGLGAALVDGRVSPDRYWLDSAGEILEQKIARKRLKVSEDLKDPSEQRLESVPRNKQTQPSLDHSEACRIAELSRSIAASRGVPQDVEWAIDADNVYILQSRPITSINMTPPRVEGRWVLFKPTAENFSEPFTPMTVDLFRRVVPPFGCFIQGRFYVNADLLEALIPYRLDEESLSDLLLMRGPPPDQALDWRRTLKSIGIISLSYLSAGITWHRTAHLPLERLQDFERCCAKALNDQDLDPLSTLRQLIINDHPFRPISEFVIQANISSGRYFVLTQVLKQTLARFARGFDQSKLGLLCSGGADMLSQQMVEGIRDLADIAVEDDVLATAMLAEDADLQVVVISLDETHPFTLALQLFLRRFGHRAVRELDLIAPRWQEDSTTVLTMVRNYLKQHRNVDATTAGTSKPRIDIHGLRLAAEDELHQA
ncbi:MAG: PEP/pyruvate-binding domain-containing protein, partial [Pseudomonadales bacterium]